MYFEDIVFIRSSFFEFDSSILFNNQNHRLILFVYVKDEMVLKLKF
jgi:hypothetical protein